MKNLLASIVFLALPARLLALENPPVESNGGHAVTAPSARLRHGYAESSIASDGEGFFAAWDDSRYNNEDVFGTRLDPEGNALDLDPIPVVATWRGDYRPIVMSNGSEYAVLNFTEYLGTFRVRVTRDGKLISGGDPLTMPGGPIAGVWNGSFYVVVWEMNGKTTLLFLDRDLQVVKEAPIAESGVVAARITAGGSNVLVVWEIVGSDHAVIARLFDTNGVALTNEVKLAFLAVQSPQSDFEFLSPVVSWNGSGYLVAWTQGTLNGALLSPAGDVVKTLTFAPNAFPRSAAIAWDGVAHLLTWEESESSSGKAALLSSTGDLLETFSLGLPSFNRSAIASNGRTFIVVRGGEVFQVRSTASPRTRSLPPISRAFISQEKPAIASGANGLLVAWFERGTVYATRLTRAGTPLDVAPIEIGTSSYDFSPQISVAAAGDVYLIAWSAATTDPRFARVTASGQVLDPGGVKLADRGGPLVASNGNEFLILWSGQTTFNRSFISAATVGRSGAAVFHDAVIPGDYQLVPIQLVWTGSDYALGWLHYLTPPCISRNCNVSIASVITRFTPDANVTSSSTVLQHGGLKGLQWNGSELVTIYNEADGLYSRPLSGSPQRIGARADGPTFFTRSSTGFSVFATRYGVPPYPWSSVSLIPLDPAGAPLGSELELISIDRPAITDATFGFGRTWATFTTFWKPMPEAHDGAINRAFYRTFSERRRNIGVR